MYLYYCVTYKRILPKAWYWLAFSRMAIVYYVLSGLILLSPAIFG